MFNNDQAGTALPKTLEEIVSKRGEISSVSYLMNNFRIFSNGVAKEILQLISK